MSHEPTNALIHIGDLDYNQRHPTSMFLRYTHDLRPLYQQLRCGIPTDPDSAIRVPCSEQVIGAFFVVAFCARHDQSDSPITLYQNPDIEKLYTLLRCSLPNRWDSYTDCLAKVVGVYKNTAFCRHHAYDARKRAMTA